MIYLHLISLVENIEGVRTGGRTKEMVHPGMIHLHDCYLFGCAIRCAETLLGALDQDPTVRGSKAVAGLMVGTLDSCLTHTGQTEAAQAVREFAVQRGVWAHANRQNEGVLVDYPGMEEQTARILAPGGLLASFDHPYGCVLSHSPRVQGWWAVGDGPAALRAVVAAIEADFAAIRSEAIGCAKT